MTGDVHKLGEVLRTAREGKGVDLARVERDTKIRERYLSALERGDYRDLPGAVYTKGFLRNYGAYLGLDPEYLIDLYRIESAARRRRAPARAGCASAAGGTALPRIRRHAGRGRRRDPHDPGRRLRRLSRLRVRELRAHAGAADHRSPRQREWLHRAGDHDPRRDRAERERQGQQPAREPDGLCRRRGSLRGRRRTAARLECRAARRDATRRPSARRRWRSARSSSSRTRPASPSAAPTALSLDQPAAGRDRPRARADFRHRAAWRRGRGHGDARPGTPTATLRRDRSSGPAGGSRGDPRPRRTR